MFLSIFNENQIIYHRDQFVGFEKKKKKKRQRTKLKPFDMH